MTADKDSPPTGPGADTAFGDFPDVGPNFQPKSTWIDLRERRAGTFATRRRDNTIYRGRRTHDRLYRAPRAGHRALRNLQNDRSEIHPAAKPNGTTTDPRKRRVVAWSIDRVVKALRSPYFTNIGIVVLLYVISFQTCFDPASVIARSFVCLGAQAAFAATVDLVVNEWTPSIQAFLAGRLIRWIGLSLLVALLPALAIIRAGTFGRLRPLATAMLARLRGHRSSPFREPNATRLDRAEQRTPPAWRHTRGRHGAS